MAGICLLAAISCNQTSRTADAGSSGYENAVIENMMTRRSIRQYKDGPVARETMQTILECGINAPNGMNRQSWEVRVVDDPEVMKEIIGLMTAANPSADPGAVKGCFRGAPTMIFIAKDIIAKLFEFCFNKSTIFSAISVYFPLPVSLL